ncbi:hypothetical protein GEMRC1_003835 [Eukaryota sp. GEM-RC1]
MHDLNVQRQIHSLLDKSARIHARLKTAISEDLAHSFCASEVPQSTFIKKSYCSTAQYLQHYRTAVTKLCRDPSFYDLVVPNIYMFAVRFKSLALQDRVAFHYTKLVRHPKLNNPNPLLLVTTLFCIQSLTSESLKKVDHQLLKLACSYCRCKLQEIKTFITKVRPLIESCNVEDLPNQPSRSTLFAPPIPSQTTKNSSNCDSMENNPDHQVQRYFLFIETSSETKPIVMKSKSIFF